MLPAVSGVEVAVSGGLSGKGVTAADGTWRAPFAAVPGPNRFSVAASTPDVVLHAFAPTRAPAQRVVVPASVALTASAEQVVAQRHRLVIHKQGDDTGYLPVAGARFQVAGQTVAADQPIELEAGVYRVTEVTPPAGYAAAGPWPVDLTGGDVTLDVIDHGVRGSVSVTKTDSSTMQPVAGATLAIRFDADHDGRFDGQPDQQIATWSSTSGPKLVSGLLPGNYQVIELAPPPGYRSATGPSPFTVAPGQQAEVTLADAPRASVAFVKSPALSGAVFAVRNDAGVELGRCTSDTDGRCTVDADRIVVGRTACWSEVAAPPGYRVAPGACLTVARGVNVVPITEVPVPVAVTAVKRDAAGGRPLAGAGYDLVRRDADGRLATVASATSGPDGRLSWPDQPPGSDYCAVERRPPPGYSVGAAPTCAMAAVGRPIAFSLTDQALPAPPITSPPATSPPATVAAVVALAPAKNAPTPAGGSLPATGRPVATVLRTGLGLVVVGFGLLGLARLSRRSGRLP